MKFIMPIPGSRRDPRLPRVRGGSFGVRTDSMLDRLSNASPFFSKYGTHRAPHASAILSPLARFDDDKFNDLILSGRHGKFTPGPGSYRTPYSLQRAASADTVLSSRTTHRRTPNARMLGPSVRFPELQDSPGPFHYSPSCGYTTVC